MENVIVISSNSSSADALTTFLKEAFRCNVTTADSAQSARQILSSARNFELVIINVPLSDESGIDLAEYASEITAANCLILIKSDHYEKISSRADRSDLLIVTKPFSKQALFQVIKAADTALKRSYALYQETVKLERKIDEIKLIDKAKFRLMQYMKMTEEEAHSYVEQYAMKNRMKKTLAATEIIDKITEQYID